MGLRLTNYCFIFDHLPLIFDGRYMSIYSHFSLWVLFNLNFQWLFWVHVSRNPIMFTVTNPIFDRWSRCDVSQLGSSNVMQLVIQFDKPSPHLFFFITKVTKAISQPSHFFFVGGLTVALPTMLSTHLQIRRTWRPLKRAFVELASPV